MKSKQIMFFATLADLSPALKDLETSFEIQYYKIGLFDEMTRPHYKSIFEKQNLGYTDKSSWMSDDNFLILSEKEELKVRTIPQKKGGVKYAVDQSMNMTSICIQLGGIYTNVVKVIIAGKIGTISDQPFSTELFNFCLKKIKKSFKKIDEFYVGNEAQEKLKSGWRLVLDEGRKKEYDLAFS